MVVAVVSTLAWGAMAEDGVVSRAASTRKPFLTPAEVIERIEKSPVEFRISPIEELREVARGKLADETWKELVKPVNYPKVRRTGAKVTITEWPIPKSAEKPFGDAERALQAKRYDEAQANYRKALKAAPDLYILHAYLGDALLFGDGDAKLALEEYSRSIEQNPDDYRLYFFRSTAHRRLEHRDEAIADLRRSLVLKPRNSVLIGAIQRSGGEYGRVEPDVFVPRAFVRMEGEAVGIYAEIERPEWLAWANCKALWLADAAHRKEMLDSTTRGFSTIEEMECLAALVSVYASRLESGEGMRDDRLDRLLKIVKDGLAGAFVTYELASRVDPQIVLHLEPDQRKLLERYVETYVLTTTP